MLFQASDVWYEKKYFNHKPLQKNRENKAIFSKIYGFIQDDVGPKIDSPVLQFEHGKMQTHADRSTTENAYMHLRSSEQIISWVTRPETASSTKPT